MVRSLIWSPEPLRASPTTYFRNATERLLERNTSSWVMRSSWARMSSELGSSSKRSWMSAALMARTILAFDDGSSRAEVAVLPQRWRTAEEEFDEARLRDDELSVS